MRWTKEKPTRAGFYWWRPTAGHRFPRSKKIRRDSDNGRLYVVQGGYDPRLEYFHLDGDPGEWSDQPIPLPEEQDENRRARG